MSIVIVPCNTRCLNMGDVAMLQVAIRRLHALWPDERLDVFTSDPEALRRFCPEVEPVLLPDWPGWTTDRYLGGRLHAWMPTAWSERVVRLRVAIGCRAPRLNERILRLRARFDREDGPSVGRFFDTIAASRLVVISGAGGVADHFRDYSNLTLLALQAAQGRRIPTVMLGHGFGPLTLPDLRAKAAAVLPGVDLIAVREERASPALLASLGVPKGRVMTTGDEAIEMAYAARPEEMGRAVGINLRIARSSAVTQDDIAPVRAGLRRFLATHPAPVLGLPIARQHELDVKVIRELQRREPEPDAATVGSRTEALRNRESDHENHGLQASEARPLTMGASVRAASAAAASTGSFAKVSPAVSPGHSPGSSSGAGAAVGLAAVGVVSEREASEPGAIGAFETAAGATLSFERADDGRELDTPLAVIQQTARCRIVVTGAYHAAVFALAQGVPAVCLARSRYFTDKFAGLADLFAVGCLLVSLDDPDLPTRLAAAMTKAWDEAPIVREALFVAAAGQIACGEAAYRRVQQLLEAARPPR